MVLGCSLSLNANKSRVVPIPQDGAASGESPHDEGEVPLRVPRLTPGLGVGSLVF